MTETVIIVFFVCAFLTLVYAAWLYKKNTLYIKKYWRHQLIITYVVNVLSFFSIAMIFYFTYGYITDDRGYFRNSLTWNKNFIDSSGSAFIWYITHPLTKIFGFDLPSCHVLFGTLGYMGSLNFLYVLSQRIDFTDKKWNKRNKIKLFAVMCFPNFMAWGRFYGKDSTMFFLASIYLLNTFLFLSEKKNKKINLFGIAISTLLMYKVRPHIAEVALISFSIGSIMRLYKKSSSFMPDTQAIYRLILPFLILIISSVFTVKTLKDMSDSEVISVDVVQGTIVNAAKMGAHGGSSTDLEEKLKTDPTIIFKPYQMILNVTKLYLSPYPWQIRGGADIIAFFSNVLLLWLIYAFRKDLTIDGFVQKYLLIMILLLTVLLSFMSGNIGLILRQKTVILPFILLFIFYRKNSVVENMSQGAATIRVNRCAQF